LEERNDSRKYVCVRRLPLPPENSTFPGQDRGGHTFTTIVQYWGPYNGIEGKLIKVVECTYYLKFHPLSPPQTTLKQGGRDVGD